MSDLFKGLKGYRTYLVAIALVLLSGLEAQSLITPEQHELGLQVLIALGFTTLRAALPSKK